MRLLPDDQRWQPAERLNGVFSMTPDNLPLLGTHATLSGLWLAEAIWVTHAAGAAAVLVALMDGQDTNEQINLLDPNRFDGEPGDDLQRRALARYRDIYSSA